MRLINSIILIYIFIHIFILYFCIKTFVFVVVFFFFFFVVVVVLLLVSIAEQAGLSLNWSHTPKTGFLVTWLIYEPPHDKTNKMIYAHSEDSDQPRNVC